MEVKLVSITQPVGIEGASLPEHVISYCARVSNPKNQTNFDTANKLLKYCADNGHWSVFEMVDATVEIKTTLDIATQILRHRSFCLSGDNELWFDAPGLLKRGKKGLRKDTVREVHRKFNDGGLSIPARKLTWNIEKVEEKKMYSVPELSKLTGVAEPNLRKYTYNKTIPFTKSENNRIFFLGKDIIEYYNKFNNLQLNLNKTSLRNRIKGAYLRSVDNKTGEIRNTHISDIWKSGTKDVFKVILKNGKSIKCTKDHQLLTDVGYKSIEEALSVGVTKSGTAFFDGTKTMYVATNGQLCYRDKEWLSSAKQRCLEKRTGISGIAEEAGCSYHTIKKWLKIHGIQFSKKETASLNDTWNKGKTGYTLTRTGKFRGFHTKEALESVQRAVSGANSHFWKGGVSSERKMIQADVAKYRKELYEEYDYHCGLCGKPFGKVKGRIDLHHIIPVSEDISLAREKTNLMPVHFKCHMEHHSLNGDHKEWRSGSKGNSKYVINYSPVVKIEYCGEEEVFDISVTDTENQNFVCNGIVVHNCFQQFSARYSEVTDFEISEVRLQDDKNRQNSLDTEDDDLKEWWESEQHAIIHHASAVYQEALKRGVAKEIARKVLPYGITSTTMYMKGSVRSWMHYTEVRCDPSTQKEHRLVANAVRDVMKEQFPSLNWG